MTWRPFEPPIVYAERHQHENVLDTLRTGDAYNLREEIRQDLLERGRNLVRRLEAPERARMTETCDGGDAMSKTGRERGRNVGREFLEDRARFIRTETVRLTCIAGAGHYSSTFSCAELLATLYYAHLKIDPANPGWEDRDRFILSKGHAAIGLYPVLADLGFFDPGLLDAYTRFGSPFGDHPDMKKVPGIDFSSGSLGHGLSVGVGIALAARVSGRSYRTFVMLGDGELCEGQVWEAAMAAGHFGLQSLIAIVDRNQLCIDGFCDQIMGVEPLDERFRSFGWEVARIDGHDIDAVLATLDALPKAGSGRPQAIIADTIKGRGVRRMELSLDWHVGNLAGADYEDVMAELGAGLKPYEKEPA